MSSDEKALHGMSYLQLRFRLQLPTMCSCNIGADAEREVSAEMRRINCWPMFVERGSQYILVRR